MSKNHSVDIDPIIHKHNVSNIVIYGNRTCDHYWFFLSRRISLEDYPPWTPTWHSPDIEQQLWLSVAHRKLAGCMRTDHWNNLCRFYNWHYCVLVYETNVEAFVVRDSGAVSHKSCHGSNVWCVHISQTTTRTQGPIMSDVINILRCPKRAIWMKAYSLGQNTETSLYVTSVLYLYDWIANMNYLLLQVSFVVEEEQFAGWRKSSRRFALPRWYQIWRLKSSAPPIPMTHWVPHGCSLNSTRA